MIRNLENVPLALPRALLTLCLLLRDIDRVMIQSRAYRAWEFKNSYILWRKPKEGHCLQLEVS